MSGLHSRAVVVAAIFGLIGAVVAAIAGPLMMWGEGDATKTACAIFLAVGPCSWLPLALLGVLRPGWIPLLSWLCVAVLLVDTIWWFRITESLLSVKHNPFAEFSGAMIFYFLPGSLPHFLNALLFKKAVAPG